MGSKKIHMRRHPAVRGNDGWGCGNVLREGKETGLVGEEPEGEGKWKTEAVGVRMGTMGKGRRWVWRGEVDVEKVGTGEKRWHEEERSHAGRRWA